MSAPRVLVTGATGLIGRHLAAPLAAAGYEVVALSRQGKGLTGDLLSDPEGIAERARADHLIHLAWHDAPTARMTAPENLDWTVASLRLLRAFAANGGKRAVMVGSCAEYDWSGAGHLGEDAPLKPATPYGAAKAATGMAAIGHGRRRSASRSSGRGPSSSTGRVSRRAGFSATSSRGCGRASRSIAPTGCNAATSSIPKTWRARSPIFSPPTSKVRSMSAPARRSRCAR